MSQIIVCAVFLFCLAVDTHGFVIRSPLTTRTRSRSILPTRIGISKDEKDVEFVAALKEAGKNDIPYVFTGGITDKMESEAAKIASRLRSVKDLGWTDPPKRRGSARPRHRAYGGQTEKPIQLKPNYDESSPLCVEKWLTQEEFYNKVGDSSPAADTVFVALAGGGAFAEREVVETMLNQWRSSGTFDEAQFLKSVQKGRTQLVLGWAVFLSLNAIFVVCLVAPNNPLAQWLYSVIGQIKDNLRPAGLP